MITLYAKRVSPTINLANIILEQASSSNVICKFKVLRGEIESLVNLVNEEVIGIRSFVDNSSF